MTTKISTSYQTAFNYFKDYQLDKKQKIEQGQHDYSLLTSLLSVNDEVRLHSRFIHSLINPQGRHYCGSLFLREFLQLIPQAESLLTQQLFNFDNAFVEIEKDNIDLLISDGYYYFIIENKLNAADQKHQLTRYIKTIAQRYDLYDKPSLEQRLVLVYLSKHKAKPSQKSESIKGFAFSDDNSKLIWQNCAQEIVNKDSNAQSGYQQVNFPDDTSLAFHHLPYFFNKKKSIETWLEQLKILPELSPSGPRADVLFSINEYAKVIQRIKPHFKRNIMNLSEFYQQHEDKEALFKFIVEAQKSANDIIALEFASQLKILLDTFDIDYSETPLNHFNSFVTKVKNWILKKGNKDAWQELTLCLTPATETTKGVKLVLAIEHAYLGFYDHKHGVASDEKLVIASNKESEFQHISFRDFNKLSAKNSARRLLKSGNIEQLITAIRERLLLIENIRQ